MALADFFWTCPSCARGSLRNEEVRCDACGTRFRRGDGSAILATAPDGSTTSRSPAEWLDGLPDPDALVEAAPAGAPIRTARVEIRRAESDKRVFGEHGYLNRVEVFGARVPGTLELWPDRLLVTPEGKGAEVWPLDDLTAVQPSSSALQLKRRGEPVVSFRFQDDALYLWDQIVCAALRARYRAAGRGEIAEFQPRIVTR